MLSDVWRLGGSECPARPIFIFLLKKIGFCDMTRDHSESNILLSRNLPIESGVR